MLGVGVCCFGRFCVLSLTNGACHKAATAGTIILVTFRSLHVILAYLKIGYP